MHRGGPYSWVDPLSGKVLERDPFPLGLIPPATGSLSWHVLSVLLRFVLGPVTAWGMRTNTLPIAPTRLPGIDS